jgi:hypothetical protein
VGDNVGPRVVGDAVVGVPVVHPGLGLMLSSQQPVGHGCPSGIVQLSCTATSALLAPSQQHCARLSQVVHTETPLVAAARTVLMSQTNGRVGVADGVEVGMNVGIAVGCAVGAVGAVGCTVDAVGCTVGPVGCMVDNVGCNVGCPVDAVGCAVGGPTPDATFTTPVMLFELQ